MPSSPAGFVMDSETYRQDSETYRFEYDASSTPTCMAVVTALAKVSDRDPTELEPLQASIDADALDALVTGQDGTGNEVHVTLTHAGYSVTVHSDGVVELSASEVEQSAEQNETVRAD